MISETIKNRRAVFPAQYNDQPISKEEILAILETANWAPTHKRTEPWRFKVFHGESQVALGKFAAETYKQTTSNFSEFTYAKFMDNPVKAGCVIAICMQRDPKESLPEWEEIAATSMAVQNMWLTVHEMGIGAYWASPGIIKHMDKLIKMEEGEQCLGFFYMGKYNDELPEGTRKSTIEEKTTWI
ncbi:nitroreductase [Aequorivita sublithincola DSM 14238]|uniref:Putative NAD(P)H nitroreductase n=1 Tax=Aequorivita sublithincola (strain DSM 14238 / LMG 21431 / ACAM 643 / 9-3) TaxID=746697 RepID=I3YVS7_AEQSU|nr:nitroreductase [Aequorivita sublithincola]AFL81095.1 nitroreductase [Aequorivita sublithincola DSM 14238]